MPRTRMPQVKPSVIAVTSGDPAGIGLEITIKAWADRAQNDIPPFVLYADIDDVKARSRHLHVDADVRRVAAPAEAAKAFKYAIPVLHVPHGEPAVPGRPAPANAAATLGAIEQATEAVLSGTAAAVVTNPIAKNVLYDAGFRHPGHTEYLAELASRARPDAPHTPVMMLCCEELKVVPLTIHVPLARVPQLITRELIAATVRTTRQALIEDFGVARPRVSVAGLNPHAGEAGAIGTEDRAIIAPAIADLRDEGIDVTGPHSADTLFHAQARSRYDVVIAMYHDQALIPIKTLAFDHGVNMTLGLPFVRTSPDHGTAFDIAGKGSARPYSLIEAMKLA